jgi:hypothetical protein
VLATSLAAAVTLATVVSGRVAALAAVEANVATAVSAISPALIVLPARTPSAAAVLVPLVTPRVVVASRASLPLHVPSQLAHLPAVLFNCLGMVVFKRFNFTTETFQLSLGLPLPLQSRLAFVPCLLELRSQARYFAILLRHLKGRLAARKKAVTLGCNGSANVRKAFSMSERVFGGAILARQGRKDPAELLAMLFLVDCRPLFARKGSEDSAEFTSVLFVIRYGSGQMLVHAID